MNSRDFAFWLQGFFELGTPDSLSSEQVACIKRHLAMVFIHEIDPSFGPEKKAELDAAHAVPSCQSELEKKLNELKDEMEKDKYKPVPWRPSPILYDGGTYRC